MPEKIRRGIIARLFATGLRYVSDAQLVAVGSRSASSADAFANRPPGIG